MTGRATTHAADVIISMRTRAFMTSYTTSACCQSPACCSTVTSAWNVASSGETPGAACNGSQISMPHGRAWHVIKGHVSLRCSNCQCCLLSVVQTCSSRNTANADAASRPSEQPDAAEFAIAERTELKVAEFGAVVICVQLSAQKADQACSVH